MPRALAYDVLERVEREGAFSDRALDAEIDAREVDDRDRRLATELVYGVLRWRRTLDRVLDEVVHGGTESLDEEVLRVLRLGVYQLLFLDRVPAHAAVDEAVEMVGDRGVPSARGLVNAVLREVGERDLEDVHDVQGDPATSASVLGARYSLPNWIANRILQIYGEERAEAVAAGLSERPPTHLRWYGDEAPESWDALPDPDGAYRAEGLTESVERALESGRAVFQDVGSQLVAAFVGASAGDSVLDAAAGQGGKTAWLADAVGEAGRVTAVDDVEWKLERNDELVRRLGVAGRCRMAAGRIEDFAAPDDLRYDRVLVDAPCSGLGVLRRHPEIRWRRREADIPSLVETQASMLEAASRWVAPGGTLTYAVCTFTTEEGHKQVDGFLESTDEFEEIGPPEGEVDWSGYVDDGGRLVVDPAEHGADCFFAARLRRVEAT